MSAGPGLQCFLGHPNNPQIHKIITRPSAFSSWDKYTETMESLFGDSIADSRMHRLDFAVDYETPFANMLTCIDVTHKRQRSEFQEKSGVKTGLIIGTGSNKILVYDKALEQGVPGSLSRIELQLTGKSVPDTKLKLLPNTISASEFSPFHLVRLNDVAIDASALTHSTEIVHRMQEFRTLLQHNGFYGARKALNQARNFDRDYMKHLTLTRWTHDPNTVLRKSLLNFFNGVNETWEIETQQLIQSTQRQPTDTMLH
jgi:hypothetical protein